MADVNRGNRPLSPHLQIYRTHILMVSSILIRLRELIKPVLGLSLSYSLRGDERRHQARHHEDREGDPHQDEILVHLDLDAVGEILVDLRVQPPPLPTEAVTEAGEPVSEAQESRASWADLRDHAVFPVAGTS